MACAFDWIGDASAPVFYDSYIARAVNGDLFFEIPAPDVSWSKATDLFWNEPIAKARFGKHMPFQVFSCWNGATVFTARPVIEEKVVFRAARKEAGECHAGEPQLFCKDMWFQGYGKIMVVPTVNLEYSNEKGREIKSSKGYTAELVAKEGEKEDTIEWLPPPDMVKCMSTFDQQSWRPWNETLT